MSEPGKAPLSLFDATAREPDSLYDRWMEGSLDDTTERAVFDQLMGSTFERDEAVRRSVIREGVAYAASTRSPLVASLRVAVRRIGQRLSALSDSLQPLPAVAVPVRSASEGPSTLSFDAEDVGRLHVSPSAAERFAVLVEPEAAADDDDEWLLLGEQGRMVTAEPEDGVVLFSSVGPSTWSLERRGGELASSSVQIVLERDDDQD